MRDGYGRASIDKIARERGVSTRTIYQRFKNKAHLVGAVICLLVKKESTPALTVIGRLITDHSSNPDSAALSKIVAIEAHHFRQLAKIRYGYVQCVVDAAIGYFRVQTSRGNLRLTTPERAAALFV